MVIKIIFLFKLLMLGTHISETSPEKEIFDLDNVKELFDEFIEKFNKNYNNETEYEYRLKIFTKNLEDVNERNNNNGTEVYGITKFMDITNEEFTRDYTGLKWDSPLRHLFEEHDKFEGQEVPDNWDWRKQGVVTPARDQGHCGTCWAFSAVGCVESQYAIKHKTLYSLSEQLLLDCYHDGRPCDDGDLPNRAFEQAAEKGGFMKLSDYLYEHAKGPCRLDKQKVVVNVTGGRFFNVIDEEWLKKLVYNYGPVSIGIVAQGGWMRYKGGIATPERLDCLTDYALFPNHAVLLVGYGTENGVPFWIMKNSQGENWGEQGFLKLIRGKKACSIHKYIAIADVV